MKKQNIYEKGILGMRETCKELGISFGMNFLHGYDSGVIIGLIMGGKTQKEAYKILDTISK